jgi:hypothetical protein
MGSTTFLLLSVLFSAVGLAYFSYGKRQGKASALLGGVALMVYPYFVKSVVLLVGLGVALSAVPFLVAF